MILPESKGTPSSLVRPFHQPVPIIARVLLRVAQPKQLAVFVGIDVHGGRAEIGPTLQGLSNLVHAVICHAC